MRKPQLKPWLNKDGNVKSNTELRKAGQQWPSSVWEKYLATLEVGRREEDVLSPAEMDTFSAEKCAGVLFSMASKKKYPPAQICSQRIYLHAFPKTEGGHC